MLSFCCLAADAMDYAEMQRAIFVETSAKTAVNIGAMFVEISKDTQSSLDMPKMYRLCMWISKE